MPESPLAQWRDIAHSGDVAALDTLLADEVVFFSPVVFRPQQGKAITKAYLSAAIAVLSGDTFRFIGEWTGPNSGVLEFTAAVDGVEINGADFIAWNEAGRIVTFKVMARPLKGINMLRDKWRRNWKRPASRIGKALSKAQISNGGGFDGVPTGFTRLG